MAMFYGAGGRTVLLISCITALAYAQTPRTCEESYSESEGVVMLCANLASTFGGSERQVAVSSTDGSATVGQDYILLENTVRVTLDQTGRDIMLACTQLQIINDGLSEGSEFFNLSYVQQSSGMVVASCLVEITDGVSGFPFLKCQESQFIAEEGDVAEVCFVLRNAETLQNQTIITANVFLQDAGTANASMDYNMSTTRFDLRTGVTEVACAYINILQDGAPERVENFYLAAIPNGMIGTPVGGDSCEVLIIDGDGPDVECPNQFNRTVGSFGYSVQPGGDQPFLQERYGDEFCYNPTVDIYTPGDLCSASGIFVADCTQWNSDSIGETIRSQSFREYVPFLTESMSDSVCRTQVRLQLRGLYDGRRTRADGMRSSCTTNCVMSVVQNDCIGMDFLLQGVSLQSVADLLSNFPLDHDNCYVNLTCCETQVPVECTAEGMVPTVTPPPLTSSTSGSRGNSSMVSGPSVGVTVGASIGGVLIVSLVVLVVVLVVVLLYYRSRKQSLIYKPQISGGEMESSGPALQAHQSAPNDHMYHDDQVVTGNGDQEMYEEITLHIGKFDQYGKWRQVFEGRIIDQSHLEVGDFLGEGAFGKVYRGKFWSDAKPPASKQVAIKTLKKASSREEIEDFMAEPALMQGFDHCNVLELLGICFDTQNHVPLIVLPYMENGDLRSFLKSKRLTDKQTSKETFPEGLSEPVLMGMCLDVAVGMQYLAAHKFVHRDLSARNCMVDSQLQVKVADFGLSRDICNSDYYRLMHNARLPVKWMAPESLYDNIYTEKTDVWSFGVVCWEVFSLGRKPYPGVENMDIPDYISNGHRLKKPTLCPDDLYESMLSTWQYHPEDRPTFDELVKLVASFYQPEDTADHQYFVLEKPRIEEPFCANTKVHDGDDAENTNAHLYTDVDFDCANDKPSYMNVSRSVQSSLIETLSGENSQQNMEPLQYEVPVPTSSPHHFNDQQITVPMEYEVPTPTTTLLKPPLHNNLPSNPDGHLYHTLESHI